jgi:hypothetical protein
MVDLLERHPPQKDAAIHAGTLQEFSAPDPGLFRVAARRDIVGRKMAPCRQIAMILRWIFSAVQPDAEWW